MISDSQMNKILKQYTKTNALYTAKISKLANKANALSKKVNLLEDAKYKKLSEIMMRSRKK